MTTAPSTAPSVGPLGQPRGIGFGILIFIVTLGGLLLIVPAIVSLVKVQGALNRYWQSKAGAVPAAAPVTA